MGRTSDASARRAARRRRVRRTLAWAAVAAVVASGGAIGLMFNTQSGPEVDPTTPDERTVAFVEEQLRAQGTPDAAFATVDDGEPTATGALGEEVTARSPFLIGSLSKPFTALSIMQLVDAGKIDLDDPVTDYIPWFTTADDEAVITVRHLLNQTSGLPTWAGQVDLTDTHLTLEQRVRAISEVAPVHEPGEVFEYCNKNFAALGLVVETVSGMSYGDYLQRHVFEPLDMTGSFTDVDAARDAGLVDGSSVWFGAHVPQKSQAFPGALPDGYVISNVEDLAHFVQAQATGSFNGQRIVSAESLEQMYSPPEQVAPDDFYDARYGAGWRVSTADGQPVVAHEGELATYRADLGLLPGEGRGLVILTAHNPMLVDPGSTYRGGMSMLAGDPAPPIDRSFFTTYLFVTAVGAIVFTALLASAVALVGRVRGMRERVRKVGRTRAVMIPVLGRLIAAAGIYVAVFYALGQAMGQPGFLRLSMSYGSVPDLTAIVLAIVGYLAVAAGVLLIAGLRSIDTSR